MNRDIMFRGKCIGIGEWAFGSLIKTEEGECFIARWSYGLELTNCSHGVFPETVGEYTGLQDKNDKKIYEGDVILRHTGRIKSEGYSQNYVVCFENGCFAMRMIDNFYKSKLAPAPAGSTLHEEDKFLKELMREYPDADCYLEVIGNIHDNPELLDRKPNA